MLKARITTSTISPTTNPSSKLAGVWTGSSIIKINLRKTKLKMNMNKIVRKKLTTTTTKLAGWRLLVRGIFPFLSRHRRSSRSWQRFAQCTKRCEGKMSSSKCCSKLRKPRNQSRLQIEFAEFPRFRRPNKRSLHYNSRTFLFDTSSMQCWK